jgi:hypothetical protein
VLEQIQFVEQRDGKQGALEYAIRALAAYRNAASYRNPEIKNKRHHAHFKPYRAHFVHAIIVLRHYIRSNK